ncbi:glycosyltransferase family 39 protein [Candidatus Beckwithbacteria bacterium]|nr:glycosyltransferase family 39 protein [Candidatus Beckwithbacteria bacterium]
MYLNLKKIIFNHIQKNKWLYLVFAMISLIYLIKLTHFPIFADEAIYINWANRIKNGDENIFYSMFDGKPPLHIWFMSFWAFIWPNLFFAGRFASVFVFLVFILFLLFYFKKYYDELLAIITVLVLSFSPFIFFHTRMAILDSSLSVFLSMFVIFLSTSKIKYHYIFSGIFLGLAYWIKTPAMFLFALPFLSFLILDRTKKNFFQTLATLSLGLALILCLKVSIWFPNLFTRSQDFTYSLSTIMTGQLSQVLTNILNLFTWINIYQSILFLVFVVVSIYFVIREKFKTKKTEVNLYLNFLLATIVFLTPLFILGKVLTPRYFLPSIFFLGFNLSFLFYQLIRKNLFVGLSLVVLILGIWGLKDYKFIFAYLNTSYPKPDEYQYFKEWSSGIGIKESMDFFAKAAKKQKIKVLTEGYFGTLPDALFVYYSSLPSSISQNMEIVGVGDPESANFLNQVKNSHTQAIYYLGNKKRINPAIVDTKLILLETYPKKDNYDYLELFHIYLSQYEN